MASNYNLGYKTNVVRTVSGQEVALPGTSTTDVMSQKAVTDELALKIDKTYVKQVTGEGIVDVMSQKAVTDELNKNECYNVTNRMPLSAGQYYDLASAIAAVPVANRKLGLKLTYMSATYEKETLTVTTAPTASGNIVITLNAVSVSIALDSAIDITPTLVATKIKSATFTGWTLSGTGATVIFTKNVIGVCSAPVYDAGTTGSVGSFVRTVMGTSESIVETQFNGNSISSWTTATNWRKLATATDLAQIETDLNKRYYIDKSIYADAPLGDKLRQICAVKDLSITGRLSGYLYWIQAKNTNEGSQLTVFRSLESTPTTYTQFVHFTELTVTRKSGKNAYTAVFSSGEIAKISIDWDELDYNCNSLTPNIYILKNDVYNGGVLFNKPIADNSITTPKIADNSITTPKIADNSITTPKIADNSITSVKLDVNVSNSIKKINNDLSLEQNLLKPKNIYASNNWSGGQILEVGNKNFTSYIKTDSVSGAEWAAYYTAFLRKTELEEMGVDFSEPIYLDFKVSLTSSSASMWVILRYGIDDNKAFYTSGTVDAIFNKNGTLQGLNSDDTETWTERLLNVTSSRFSLSKLLIPPVYESKNLYAVMFCVSEPKVEGLRVSRDIGIFVNSDKEYCTLFRENNELNEIDNIKLELQSIDSRVDGLEQGTNPPLDIYWAVCGDSITNANHNSIYDIPIEDAYTPIDGYPNVYLTYKRKNYAYYVARRNRLKWANYGFGGTTLTHCAPKAYPNSNFYPFVDERIENLKEGIDWDYISIFFGWNDCAFNPIYQRDLWLYETYGLDIGYPVTAEQIGASGFANQSQKDACDAVIGEVGGIQYDNNNDYFFAKFIGTINDFSKNTWYGAWNYCMEYLMKKYKKSKILIFAPYLGSYSLMVRQSVINIANKWGVNYFDFENLPYWYYKTTPNNTPLSNPNDINGKWYTENNVGCAPTVQGYNQSRMSYDTLHPSNLGYIKISEPISNVLLCK